MGLQALVVILLITNIALFFFLWRSVNHSQSKESDGPGELVHDNMLMQRELQDFSDEMFEKLDIRISGLQKLIKEADDRISTLDSMDLPKIARDQARREAAEARQANNVNNRTNSGGGQNQRRTAILSLARKGMSSELIAQEVGMGRGEVEFILNIEKQRKG
jgi:hypothetical protein